MATRYRLRQPIVSKYIVHPHYTEENEAQIDHQVRNHKFFFKAM